MLAAVAWGSMRAIRAVTAVLAAIADLWGRGIRRDRRQALLLAVIPRILGDQALTIAQIARRAQADTLWPYGAIWPGEAARALAQLEAAGRVIGERADGGDTGYRLRSSSSSSTQTG